MVGNYAHCNVGLCIVAVFFARNLANALDYWLEHVGVVVRLLALQCHAEALKAHAGVNYLCRKLFKVAVGHAVILHEHKIPNFNHLRVRAVYKVASGDCCALLIAAEVDVNFTAWAAWACIAHFPEVVLEVAVEYSFGRKVLLPNCRSLIVPFKAFACSSLENCCVEALRVKLYNLCEEFPCPVNCLLLEIVAE